MSESLSSWACSSPGHLGVTGETPPELLNVKLEDSGFLKDTHNSSNPAVFSAYSVIPPQSHSSKTNAMSHAIGK